ncbi:protein quiver-like [Uloborus diversus]|uniref:protein quiver-like n=1 Tax=Uloborus diversus TaxID=327109 RepID=UPI00240971FC|nr:protein quiver-like [Uloborus diversus]
MATYRELLAMQSVALVIGIFFLTTSEAEEECLSGKSYWCYECDTWSDPRCKDPFNWTALPSELPQQKQCDGCCVKIVTNSSKPNEVIRRTCTKNIVINLFMVDHVCMYDGYKTGHMCFCEGDSCNSVPSLRPPTFLMILLMTALSVFAKSSLIASQLL